MRLSAPKQITFWIAVILAVIGVILSFVVGAWAWWLVVVAFVLLALGNLLDGL
jgi:hypothetical protein